MDERIPGYMVKEEVQRDLPEGKAGQRTWRFEERLEKGEDSRIARKCLEEVKNKEL